MSTYNLYLHREPLALDVPKHDVVIYAEGTRIMYDGVVYGVNGVFNWQPDSLSVGLFDVVQPEFERAFFVYCDGDLAGMVLNTDPRFALSPTGDFFYFDGVDYRVTKVNLVEGGSVSYLWGERYEACVICDPESPDRCQDTTLTTEMGNAIADTIASLDQIIAGLPSEDGFVM